VSFDQERISEGMKWVICPFNYFILFFTDLEDENELLFTITFFFFNNRIFKNRIQERRYWVFDWLLVISGRVK